MIRRPPRSTLFPYNDALPISRDDARPAGGRPLLLKRGIAHEELEHGGDAVHDREALAANQVQRDRKSTRLNSSHSQISYAVFCLKKKKKKKERHTLRRQQRYE